MIHLNSSYILRNDRHRSIIFEKRSADGDPCISGWISRVHPVYTMLLSYFTKPTEIDKAYEICQSFLQCDRENAQKLIDSFINEEVPFSSTIQGEISEFPPKLLVKSEGTADKAHTAMKSYSAEDFIYTPPVDLKTQRIFVAPVGLVWVVTDRCVTDCVYCYANKNHAKKWMDSIQIERFIADAKVSGIRDIFLSGGELFLHPEWKRILDLLHRYDLWPGMISTKMPMTEEIVETLKQYPPVMIQISLDSLDRQTLCETLKVKPSYIDDVKHGIELLEKNRIHMQLASVLTKKTASIANLEEMRIYLSSLGYLNRWTIRIGFPSLYSSVDYNKWKVNKEFKSELDKWYEEAEGKSKFTISLDKGKEESYNKSTTGSKDFPGARCSANITHMVILPDGKVTICEQLYWNPRFIIGDILNNSIQEIWQGAQASRLARFPQNSIGVKSPCGTCELYDKCQSFPNKCYPDILKAYGDDNWDFPDLRCAFAPPHIHEL